LPSHLTFLKIFRAWVQKKKVCVTPHIKHSFLPPMVKRGSPGVDVEKTQVEKTTTLQVQKTLQVELNSEDAQKLQIISRDIARIELVLGASLSLSFFLLLHERLAHW
jgi:hypothetical protein